MLASILWLEVQDHKLSLRSKKSATETTWLERFTFISRGRVVLIKVAALSILSYAKLF